MTAPTEAEDVVAFLSRRLSTPSKADAGLTVAVFEAYRALTTE